MASVCLFIDAYYLFRNATHSLLQIEQMKLFKLQIRRHRIAKTLFFEDLMWSAKDVDERKRFLLRFFF